MGRFFHTHKHLHTHSHTHTDRQTEPRESGVLKKEKYTGQTTREEGTTSLCPRTLSQCKKPLPLPAVNAATQKEEEGGGGGEGIPRRWKSQGGGTLRRWNSQRSGTPEAGPGGGTPRGVELLGGGSPREVELPGGRRVELPGGGTRRREFPSAGHLKTQAQIPI